MFLLEIYSAPNSTEQIWGPHPKTFQYQHALQHVHVCESITNWQDNDDPTLWLPQQKGKSAWRCPPGNILNLFTYKKTLYALQVYPFNFLWNMNDFVVLYMESFKHFKSCNRSCHSDNYIYKTCHVLWTIKLWPLCLKKKKLLESIGIPPFGDDYSTWLDELYTGEDTSE